MRTINKVLIGILTFVMVFSMIGCTAKKSEAVTIHVLTQDQAGMKPAEIDQIARDFEALNPGYQSRHGICRL